MFRVKIVPVFQSPLCDKWFIWISSLPAFVPEVTLLLQQYSKTDNKMKIPRPELHIVLCITSHKWFGSVGCRAGKKSQHLGLEYTFSMMPECSGRTLRLIERALAMNELLKPVISPPNDDWFLSLILEHHQDAIEIFSHVSESNLVNIFAPPTLGKWSDHSFTSH